MRTTKSVRESKVTALIRGAVARERLPFLLLCVLLVLSFMFGGSSRAEAPFLFVLRSVSVLAAFYAASRLSRQDVRSHRAVLVMAGLTLLLTLSHIVPLPPALWQALPGRDLLRAIDQASGAGDVWRPISLVPSTTYNALFFLATPIAVLLLAIQLDTGDRIKILYVVLALTFASAAVGLLQIAGMPIMLYGSSTRTGVLDASGLFGNRNHQAALLAAVFPMLAVGARLAPSAGISRRLADLTAVAVAVLLVPMLILTGSRAGLMLGGIAILFTLFYGLLEARILRRMSPRVALLVKAGAALAVTAVIAGITMIAARGLAIDRLESVAEDLRPKLWASIMPVVPDYLPLGSGVGSYVEVYQIHEPFELLRPTYSNHAHNEYLEVALTAGVPGMLLIAVAAILVLAAAWRNRSGASPERLLGRLGVTIIVILACASVTDYPLRTPILASLFVLAAIWCTPGSRGQDSRVAAT